MKAKKIVLSLVLCCMVLIAPFFALAGCDKASIADIEKSYKNFIETAESYSSVFKQDSYNGRTSKFFVNYGSGVNSRVTSEKERYVELKTRYNYLFVEANFYIEDNIDFILSSKDVGSKQIKAIDDSLKSYTSSLKNFVKARLTLVNHFDDPLKTSTETQNYVVLGNFKKIYGEMVAKSVQVASNIAKGIKSSKAFDRMKNRDTNPTEQDLRIVEDYVYARVLPVYSELMLSEIENKFDWYKNSQNFDHETKQRIENLVSSVEKTRTTYKMKGRGYKTLTAENFKKLLNNIDAFTVELDNYFEALKGLKIRTLAVDYDYKMEQYLRKNKMAENFLEKLEEFSHHDLSAFLQYINSTLF